jgi:uncharacterized membrane protein YedE/YeeE
MPIEGLIGGALIGTAAAIMLLGLGRIAGVSGMAARATGIADTGVPRGIAIAFVIGLLVGFGTRLGSGCTSGHGVCGMSRLSRRSIIATAMFMASGFVTVGLMRLGGLL